MQLSVSLAACVWSACAAAGLPALPASAQPAAPAPAAPSAAVPPVQGAAQMLDRVRQIKSLAALNPDLTNESAAMMGITLVLADSLMSGMATALSPKDKSPQAAQEKAFQNKAEALLNCYSLNDKFLNASPKADTLPPALVARGHQFLTDALALSNDYEKSSASAKNPTLGSQFSGSDFPASSRCTFHVLSPTRVKIVPRSDPKSYFEAHLEGGQWRLDLGSLMGSQQGSSAPAKPRPATITPRAAAFLKAVDDDDAAAVEQALKADPGLANTPPSFYKGQSGLVSDLPLSLAAFHDNVPIVTLLIRAGAKVNAENDFGDTALDQAAQFGNKAAVAVLLAHGASVTHKNGLGQTPLHLAADGDDPGTLTLLLAHGANINARDDEGKTPLAVALDPSNQGMNRAAILALLRRHGAKK